MSILGLDLKEQEEINKYIASCSKRKLAKNYYEIYYHEITKYKEMSSNGKYYRFW